MRKTDNLTLEDWNAPELHWKTLQALVPVNELDRLQTAFRLASKAHAGALRKSALSSAPYIVHPLRVARIVAEEWGRQDLRTMLTCLLHDVIEEGAPEIQRELEETVGNEVCDAVWILTKPRLPQACPPETRAARDARYFLALRRAPAWVRLVKCADRLDNLRDARRWGDAEFWGRYSSETIGWHLYLAKETAPMVEVALFSALVAGSREIRGRVPVWADGHLVDPNAARLIPEHIAHYHQVIGLALRGNTLVAGMLDSSDYRTIDAVSMAANMRVEAVDLSREAILDALAAGLYGRLEIPDI